MTVSTLAALAVVGLVIGFVLGYLKDRFNARNRGD